MKESLTTLLTCEILLAIANFFFDVVSTQKNLLTIFLPFDECINCNGVSFAHKKKETLLKCSLNELHNHKYIYENRQKWFILKIKLTKNRIHFKLRLISTGMFILYVSIVTE